MNTFTKSLSYLALVVITTGCRAMLPSESSRAQTPWKNFEEAQIAYDRVIPHKTTVEELKEQGFDPHMTPNVRILTYVDLINYFLPNDSISMKDLQPDVRACIESKDCCHAYLLELEHKYSERYGSVFLDIFGFKKKTHVTGWNFKALIIMKDGIVAYKIRSGEPHFDRHDKKVKPLGPLQELDGMVMRVPGML
jgi:hypothetical protein